MADDDGLYARSILNPDLMLLFQIANRFSFLLLPLLVFAVAALILVRRHVSWRPWAAWTSLLVVFLVYVLLSGQVATAGYNTPENIRRSLATAGQPTLVEFYSNY